MVVARPMAGCRASPDAYRVLAGGILNFRSGRRWDVRMEGVATSHEVMPNARTSPTWPGT